MTNTLKEKTNEITVPPVGNLFRDTPIRYLGYANEVGESFRYQYPKFVLPSYLIAFGYCVADAISTGYNAYHTHNLENKRIQRSVIGTFDALLWQSLASVAIPGYCIHMVVKVTKSTLTLASSRQIQIPIIISIWVPTISGLLSIPLIVHPIDHSVDYVLDKSIRTWYRQYL
jgi:mitochondrial fission process protein 1